MDTNPSQPEIDTFKVAATASVTSSNLQPNGELFHNRQFIVSLVER